MFKLKTKWFKKWSSRNKISDKELLNGLENFAEEKGVTDLGSGLFKMRLARLGQGKRGGYRTLIACKKGALAVYVYGFGKNEKDNIDKKELEMFKKLAETYCMLSEKSLNKAIRGKELFELEK